MSRGPVVVSMEDVLQGFWASGAEWMGTHERLKGPSLSAAFCPVAFCPLPDDAQPSSYVVARVLFRSVWSQNL